MLTRLATLTALFAALSHTAYAADSNTIKIRADFMQLDVKNGSSEYRGNVVIEKGNISLNGDSVTIDKQDGGINRITIKGSPARYQQTGSNPVHAQSSVMLFDVGSNILTLKTDASLQQNQQLIESHFIQFDTDKQVLLAGSDKKQNNGKQRVNIILDPAASTGSRPGNAEAEGRQP